MSQGPVYDVVVLEEEPFVVNDGKDASGNASLSGLTIDLVKLLAEKAQIRYKFRLTDHTSYGHKDQSSQQWKGLLSEIIGTKASPNMIAAGPIPITRENEEVVDMSKPFMSTGVSLLVKKPSAASEGIALMLEPFAAEVWVMIVLAFIVVSLAIFLLARFSPFERAKQGRSDTYNPRSIFGLRNSFLFACTTFGLQGYRQAPRSISGRIAVCIWFMFIVFVLVAYVANLAAILTTRGRDNQQRLPFSGAADLMIRGDVKLGAVKYGYVYSDLEGSQAYKYISDKDTGEWVQTVQEGVQRVKDFGGDFALLLDTQRGIHVTNTNCDLMTHGSSLASYGFGFALPKKSRVLDKIKEALLRTIENGEMQMLINKYFHDRRVCPETSSTANDDGDEGVRRSPSLDMNDMAIPFLFLFLGLLGAGAALGAEIYYLKWRAEQNDPDAKARQPLNTEAGSSKAPKTSPPPPPIYKVNNKLQEQQLKEQAKTADPEAGQAPGAGSSGSDGGDTEKAKGSSSIEASPGDDKVEADRTEDETSQQKQAADTDKKPEEEVEVAVAGSSPTKASADVNQTTAEVVSEVA